MILGTKTLKNQIQYNKEVNSRILPIMLIIVILFSTIDNSAFASSLLVEGSTVEYEMQDGTINDISLDFDFSSLAIDFTASNDGELQISIPRSLLDAKIGNADDIFFVLVDDLEVTFEEINTTDSTRTLLIKFPQSSSIIEIIGTDIKTTTAKETVVETVTEQPQSTTKGGGCLIATAAYGSELAPQVQQLRELRDNSLLQTESGTSFMESFNDFYYSFSPIIADYERENPVFREMVKIAITPMISSLSILNYVDMDSEVEVLGYGISLILLNVGMYFVAPAIVIVGTRKKF